MTDFAPAGLVPETNKLQEGEGQGEDPTDSEGQGQDANNLEKQLQLQALGMGMGMSDLTALSSQWATLQGILSPQNLQALAMGGIPASALAGLGAGLGGPGMQLLQPEPSVSDGQRGSGQSKMRRAAWTQDEENRLVDLANRYQQNGQRMCWRVIAQELGTGRTSKQCREHYLNSLRPNMKKGQWTQKEEYVIAKEHSRIGSHWCQIAKKLPGRTDNSIKNFYNATVRSKAINKNESFLWLYVERVKAGVDPKIAFTSASETWVQHVQPHVAAEVMSGRSGKTSSDGGGSPTMAGLGALGNPLASGLNFTNEALEALSNSIPGLSTSLLQQVAGFSNASSAAAAAAAAAAVINPGGAAGMPGLTIGQNGELLLPPPIGRAAAEDGAEALMLLSGKRKGPNGEDTDGIDIGAYLARTQAPHTNLKLQELLSGFKRDKPDGSPADLTALLGGADQQDAKRVKLLEQHLGSSQGGAAGVQQFLNLGLDQAGGDGAGDQQQPGGQPMSLELIQQQLLLQQLLSAATTGQAGGGNQGSGSPPPGSATPGTSAAAAAGSQGSLATLLQQITAQSVLLAQQAGTPPAGSTPQAAGNGPSLLSLLGVGSDGAGQLLGQGDDAGGNSSHDAAQAAAQAVLAEAAGLPQGVLMSEADHAAQQMLQQHQHELMMKAADQDVLDTKPEQLEAMLQQAQQGVLDPTLLQQFASGGMLSLAGIQMPDGSRSAV